MGRSRPLGAGDLDQGRGPGRLYLSFTRVPRYSLCPGSHICKEAPYPPLPWLTAMMDCILPEVASCQLVGHNDGRSNKHTAYQLHFLRWSSSQLQFVLSVWEWGQSPPCSSVSLASSSSHKECDGKCWDPPSKATFWGSFPSETSSFIFLDLLNI